MSLRPKAERTISGFMGYTSVVNSDKASVISDKSPTTKAKRPSAQTSGLALAC